MGNGSILSPGIWTGEIRLTEEEKRQIIGENKEGEDMKKGIVFPGNILESLKNAENGKREAEERRRKNKAEEKRKKKEEKKELQSRLKNEKLRAMATEIIGWIKDFGSNEEGRKIFEICKNEVQIFTARYWLGKPAPGSVTTCCTLSLVDFDDGESYGYSELTYCEVHKGMGHDKIEIGLSEDEIIKALHPDLIVELWEGIKSGKVWENIDQSIKKAVGDFKYL